MFSKILIANRGEIACRIIGTAQKMGIAVVAVYSDADASARHVALADEAVHIGASPPVDSYLRADRIIQAALDKGAQAIHPGYGFLSENPDFVEQIQSSGLIFIGPSADAIRAMGLKDAAKILMEKANVPVVPGYHGSSQDDAILAAEAAKIGYPVLIKAVAGGGGKGMRMVEVATDFHDALASARAEARTGFGNDAVLVEKYIQQPRHIEIQVFGDGKDAVHLYERDCSLQRRHQKVIEEAPAPGMTETMRRAMGQAAVAAAKTIGYSGAGTVEFIVDASDGLRPDRFWFMEMNTRLQVEHPVTEAVTGIDLVEWQLRVASGEGLPLAQDEISLNGHAFEARLYAENVPAGFLPATGTLTHLKFPAGARADTGVRAGDTITPFYDPMIAKVTVHGPTRASALRRLSAALEGTQVAGLVTNLGFLGALTRHKGFAAGEVDTGLIARDLEALTSVGTPAPWHIGLAALAAAGLLDRHGSGFHIWTPLERVIKLKNGEEDFEIKIKTLNRDKHILTIEDQEISARCLHGQHGQWEIDGNHAPPVSVVDGIVTVFTCAGLVFEIIDPLVYSDGNDAGADMIIAPMPGLVREIFCAPGQAVHVGQKLAILEAMKMEHTLIAKRDGIVAEVLAKAGDQVEAGAPLVCLEEEAEDSLDV